MRSVRLGEVLSVADAASIVAKLNPGERFCYFVGDLMLMRSRSGQIDALAAYMLSVEGTLTQKRVGVGVYRYIYTKG